MDRVTSLTVFVQVVDSGGFAAAARRLAMSTTMVSSHVQALETRLGARLLNRTTRKVALTETGAAYYERCTRILADLEEADQLAGALQTTLRGTLRVYVAAPLVRFVAPVVTEFLAAHDGLSVQLTAGNRDVDVLEEGFDLAIRPTPPPESSLIVRQLTPWRHVLCGAPSYLARHAAPRSLAALARHNCLRFAFYPFGDSWRFIGQDGTPASIRIRGNLVTNSPEMLRLAALGGQGLLLAPTFLIGGDLEAGTLVRVLEDHEPVGFTINAVYPHRHHVSTKVRRFLDLVAARLEAHRQAFDPRALPHGLPQSARSLGGA